MQLEHLLQVHLLRSNTTEVFPDDDSTRLLSYRCDTTIRLQ